MLDLLLDFSRSAVYPMQFFRRTCSSGSAAFRRLLPVSFIIMAVLAITMGAPTASAQPVPFGPQDVISTNADGAQSVATADIDGDGDLDVLSASDFDDKIALYRNDGTGAFAAQEIISTNAVGARSVATADIDGDGDLDVLSASFNDDKIALYRNDGTGAFAAQEVITTNADAAQSVTTADIDGDGDLDALSASAFDNDIALYRNDGTGTFGAKEIISTDAVGASSVATGDIDSDGDLDVLSASSLALDNKIAIALYRNDGTGTFGGEEVISRNAGGAAFVATGDIDGDGDLDVLSASSIDNEIALYRNDGTGTFGAEEIISTNALGAQSVAAADIDGDGDLDVLSASFGDDKIALYRNDGTGAFGAEEIISTNAVEARSVATADIDGDGDLDVLSASFDDDKIALYRNQSPPLAVETLPTGFPGETLTVDLVAGSADTPLPDLFGAGVTLTYDPTLIQYVSAAPGSFLDLSGGPDSSPLFDVSTETASGPTETSGRVSIGLARKRGASYDPPADRAVLATIEIQVAPSATIGDITRLGLRDILVTDANGAPLAVAGIRAEIEIVPEKRGIWPGDANNSGQADPSAVAVTADDLLPIGLCFGVEGTPRDGEIDLTWERKETPIFGFPGGSDPCTQAAVGPEFDDPVFADGTGDGRIDGRDVVPIGVNFGRTRGASTLTLAQSKRASDIDPITLQPPTQGEEVILALTRPATGDGLFGLAVQLRLPSGLYEVIGVDAGPALDDGDLLSVQDMDASSGRLEAAFTRKRGATATASSGDLLRFRLRAMETRAEPVTVSVDRITASRIGQPPTTLLRAELASPSALDIPSLLALDPPAPNPVSVQTVLTYQIPDAGQARMTLYDALGRKVAVLLDKSMQPGSYAKSVSADALSSGIYFVRLESGGTSVTQKISVVR